jgi:hypothetical protein
VYNNTKCLSRVTLSADILTYHKFFLPTQSKGRFLTTTIVRYFEASGPSSKVMNNNNNKSPSNPSTQHTTIHIHIHCQPIHSHNVIKTTIHLPSIANPSIKATINRQTSYTYHQPNSSTQPGRAARSPARRSTSAPPPFRIDGVTELVECAHISGSPHVSSPIPLATGCLVTTL